MISRGGQCRQEAGGLFRGRKWYSLRIMCALCPLTRRAADALVRVAAPPAGAWPLDTLTPGASAPHLSWRRCCSTGCRVCVAIQLVKLITQEIIVDSAIRHCSLDLDLISYLRRSTRLPSPPPTMPNSQSEVEEAERKKKLERLNYIQSLVSGNAGSPVGARQVCVC